MEQAIDVSEKRRHPRRLATFTLEVSDLESKQLMGTLVNISLDGILLLSHSPLKVDNEYKIGLELPDAIFGDQSVQFKARSVWSDTAPNDPNQYWTGFSIVEISETDWIRIEKLINVIFAQTDEKVQ